MTEHNHIIRHIPNPENREAEPGVKHWVNELIGAKRSVLGASIARLTELVETGEYAVGADSPDAAEAALKTEHIRPGAVEKAVVAAEVSSSPEAPEEAIDASTDVDRARRQLSQLFANDKGSRQ